MKLNHHLKQYLRKVVPGILIDYIKSFKSNIAINKLFRECKSNNYYASYPSRVRIELSSACNLKCRHCPTGASMLHGDHSNISRGMMTVDVFNEIVKQIIPMNSVQSFVLYLGGESLLNKNFFQFTEILKTKTKIKDLRLVTNGMLLTDPIATQILDSGIIDIEVSIDGKSPDENNDIRVGSDYNLIKHNLLNLYHLSSGKINISISNVQIAESIEDLKKKPKVPDFLIRDFPTIHINSYYAMKWPGYKEDWVIKNKYSVINFGYKNRSKCSMPFNDVSIRYNGDIVMCCYDITSANIMGNINNKNLIDIWNSELYRSIRKGFLTNNSELIPDVCRSCPIFTKNMLLKVN